jgi:hypothetical protein
VSWADKRLHPTSRCAFCGAREKPSAGIRLIRCVVQVTQARALRCSDEVACLRRLQEQGRRDQEFAA